MGKLVEHLFDGSARRLVAHLIEDGTLDDRDRDEIGALLDARSGAPAANGGTR